MNGYRTFGGNYDEWGIACPDGEVWPDTATTKATGLAMLAGADKDCGCEQKPHVLVWRDVPEWEAV